MSVVAAYTYRAGKRVRQIDLTAADGLKLADGEFAWIGLYEPTEAELRILQLLADIDEARATAFPTIVEHDPAWNMLAELLRARLLDRRVSVTSLCLSSRTPVTTA